MKLVAQIFVACVTLGIIFIVIASVSFTYYVEKNRPDSEAIEAFLTRLRFPADRVFGFLPSGRLKTAAADLASEPHGYIVAARAITGWILIANIVFWGWIVFRQTSLVEATGNGIILIYMVTVSYFSWRFGHRLRQTK